MISYSAVKRTSEIGIRLALGAQRQDILGLVLWQGLKLAGITLLACYLPARRAATLDPMTALRTE